MSMGVQRRSVGPSPNVHSARPTDVYLAEAFDAGEVSWINDVPLFDTAPSALVDRPAPKSATEKTERPRQVTDEVEITGLSA